MEPQDSVGNLLNDGDTIVLTKTLKIKGMSTTLKIGDKVQNIKLINDINNIECRVGKSLIVLKTIYIKKSW